MPHDSLRLSATSLLIALSGVLSCSSEDTAPTSSGVDAAFEASNEQDASPSEDATPEADPPEASQPDVPDVESPPPPTEIDPSRLADTLAWLSADDMGGRLTGTASGDKAEAEIVKFLEATGIEVRKQETVFPLYEVESLALSVVDAGGDVLDSFAYVDEIREVDFSGNGEVEGDLYFIGYGLTLDEHNSYEGIDVTGKVVAILTGVPSGLGLQAEDDGRVDEKINAAWEHGATGVVFIPAGAELSYDLQRKEEAELTAEDKYLEFHPELFHDGFPSVYLHAASTSKLMGKTAQALASAPEPFDVGKRVRLEASGTVHAEAKCNNVFGVLEGKDPDLAEEVIILGAHYDHLGIGADGRVFNGAADNASGTAVVMEVAAALAASEAVPKRTVLLALWCGEEQGWKGSLEYGYYGTPFYPIKNTKLMVQVDYLDNEDGPYITNVDDNPLIAAFLGDAGDHSEYPVMRDDWHGDCASDDCVFLLQGLPAYRFISEGPHHHRADDDFANLNLPLIGRVAEVCLGGIGAVAY
jgi:Peptidase family M28